tara:strand:+ start:200 stop:463 length:264 start_codon:yes stop_codon:yes gene_type:complete
MIRELKLFFFILAISFFVIFTARYYFSDTNKKNMHISTYEIDNKIEVYSENLVLLKNDTNKIIKYIENENEKKQKKYFFWKLLKNND